MTDETEIARVRLQILRDYRANALQRRRQGSLSLQDFWLQQYDRVCCSAIAEAQQRKRHMETHGIPSVIAAADAILAEQSKQQQQQQPQTRTSRWSAPTSISPAGGAQPNQASVSSSSTQNVSSQQTRPAQPSAGAQIATSAPVPAVISSQGRALSFLSSLNVPQVRR